MCLFMQIKEVNIGKEPLLRLILMGRKSLPDPSKKIRPYWGFVEMVTTKIEDVKDALKGGEKNEPQESLSIEREASFIIQIKNPDQHGSSSRFSGLETKRKAVFPAHLQASDDIEEELGLELKGNHQMPRVPTY
ncbi:hypothetical protein IFM89_016763 [Coptis chinensis]|uniref:Uncharacterized protein n=1 Tax=Coptis chinensis TaxID=261450 RepID=A0A835H4V6_9MAGN|nr:hypothetical protein IFM89_016763 [Coptis chinensis]